MYVHTQKSTDNRYICLSSSGCPFLVNEAYRNSKPNTSATVLLNFITLVTYCHATYYILQDVRPLNFRNEICGRWVGCIDQANVV